MDDATLLSWIVKGKNISAFLVVAGVAGEFLGDFIAGPIQDRIEAKRRSELAQLTARSTASEERIAEAEARAAAANLELAKLRSRTEFRHLTPDQQKTVAGKLKKFSGIEYAIAIFNVGDDSSAIGDDITKALAGPDGAGWKQGSGSSTSASAPETGIIVEWNLTASPLGIQAAKELSEALRAEGLFAPPARVVKSTPLMGAINPNAGSTWEVGISVERRP